MRLDVWASATHYLDHIAPVWRSLDPAARGTFYVDPKIADHAAAIGLDASTDPMPKEPYPAVLTAASGNLNHARAKGRQYVAIMEHGCGLSYGGDRSVAGRVARDSSSYAGGKNRQADLFLHPGPHPAARDRAEYPRARVEVVGSPRLDSLPAREPDGGPPVVAFSFHWDTTISRETRSCFIYYREHLALLAKEARRSGRLRLIGHGHPRIMDRLDPWYRRKGIEVVRDFDEVCRRADMYVVDNSSTLYEFASTGRRVMVLNGPFYRPHIEHGLRFWDAADVGPNVWEPYDIIDLVPRYLLSDDVWADRREAALDKVYAYRDEGAADRAARVLEDWLSSLPQPAHRTIVDHEADQAPVPADMGSGS